MTNLDNLITRANNVLGALEGLIEGDAAETPIVDTSVPYDFPAIAFDEANDAWTLTQDTADSADGLYKGVYRLALETGCANLEIVSIVTHQNPTSGAPASWRSDPASAYVDEASVNALTGKQVNAFKIQSSIPYEIKVRVTECNLCTYLETLSVSVRTGATVQTATTTVVGKEYRLKISGSGRVYNVSQPYGYGDAFYHSYTNWSSANLYSATAGFAIDGTKYSPAPAYDDTHVYEIVVNGTGAKLNLRFLDPAYNDNDDWSLTVEVCELN